MEPVTKKLFTLVTTTIETKQITQDILAESKESAEYQILEWENMNSKIEFNDFSGMGLCGSMYVSSNSQNQKVISRTVKKEVVEV